MTDVQARMRNTLLHNMKIQDRSRLSVAKAVSERCGCSAETVMRYLRNEHSCNSKVLLFIMDELGIDVRPTKPPVASAFG